MNFQQNLRSAYGGKFFVGAGKTAGNAVVSKLNIYSIRLYNRGLSDEEIELNYNKSKAFIDSMK